MHPEHVEEFDALVKVTVEGINAHEEGTIVYLTTAVTGEPEARVFIEIYRDEESFRAHEQQPHTVRFLAERERLVNRVRVEFLTAVGGKLPDWG